jgi:hypothetical protein
MAASRHHVMLEIVMMGTQLKLSLLIWKYGCHCTADIVVVNSIG